MKIIKIILFVFIGSILNVMISKITGWDTDFAFGYISGAVVCYFSFNKK